MIYEIDGHQLDTVRFELRRAGELVAVEPQVFEVLRHLVVHRERVVDKRELLDEVWGTRFVTESALTSRIKAARRDLSANHLLVHYDERGCGLSDWDPPEVGFDTWVTDLTTVVDQLGLDRFALLGISQGGAVAAAFAAQHPERVSHLVLYGAFPEGRIVRARSELERRDAAMMLDLLETGWARQASTFGEMFAAQFMPEGTPEQWAAFVELQERTTSPTNARRLMEVSSYIDVTELAPTITVPTLVLHAGGDRRVPLPQGELFASLIPGARLCVLDSPNHILLDGEPAWARFLEEVEAFLAT